MRLKQCIFALMAMLLCAFSANAQVTTEAALKDALTTGGEVTLGADINVAAQIEIPAGKTVVLDLAGYDIVGGWNGSSTTNHIYVLSNRGTLTIEDSSADAEGKIVSRGIYNYGELTLDSGTIDACDGNGGYAVNNESGSTFIMNGGVVSASYEDGDAPGNYDATALDVPAGCTATLNGGKITSVTNFTFAISLAGELIVPETSTVEVTGAHGAISMSAGSADIDGGTFICSGVQGQTDNVVYVTGGSMDISGGTFEHTGNLVNADSGAAIVMSGANGELTISGGEFTGLNGSVSGNANTTLTGGSYGSVLGYDSWDNIKQYVPEGETVTIEGESYTNVAPAVGVAKIGSTTYATFADALTAASAMSGDVTIEVYDKVTLNTAFSGSYSSINFVGKDTDAEIYLDVQGYITATGKKVSFTDLTLSKSAGVYITNAGFMNVAFGIYDVVEVAYTNCVFANGAYASSGNVTFNNCTFYRSYDKYGLWAYGNVDVAVEGCTFADYRGIKMYAEGAAKTVDLTVKNTNFSAVTDKPAIVLTYGESVVLEGNTYSSTGTFELDLDGAPNGTAVTSDVAPTCKNDNGTCGVLVDGKIYTTVAQAVEVATEGSNVTLLYSTTETAEFAEGVNLTLANGVTADNVTVATSAIAKVNDAVYFSLQEALDAAAAGTGNVTVEILADVNLTGIDWNPVTVSAPGYPVVTVEGGNHTITGLNDMLFAGTWAGGSGLIIKNLTIANSAIVNDKDDAKGTVGVGAFIGYPQASATITLENCHLKNSSVEGGHWTGGLIGMAGGYNGNDGPVFMNLTIKGCSVTGSTITGKGSVGGVIGHGSCAAWTNVVIEETTVSGNTITSTGSSNVKAGAIMGTIGAAGQPTTANGETKTGGASVSATVADNTVTSNGTAITTIYGRQGTNTGQLYVAGGSYDNYPIEQGVAYAAPIEGYEIVQNTDGTYGVQEIPAYVAKIGEQGYPSLAEAVAAAQAGDEIVLLGDVETADGIVITDKNLVINLNGKTYTTTEGASTNNRNFKIEGTSVVTIKNGTMVAAGDYSSGAYGTVRTEGNANVTLEDLKLYNYRGNGLNIKALGSTVVTINDTEIYSNYGGGIESAGGTIEIANVKVEQKGMYTAPYNSMAISVNGGGKVTVNSGTFSTECITAEEANNQGTSHGPWVAGVLNSGGTLIINGGTFSNDNFGENSLATNARGAILADTKAKVEINGGTFNVLKNVIDIQNNLGDANNNPSVVLAGGTYNADPRISAQYGSNLITLADGYAALPDLNGNYVVGAKPTATVNNLGMTTVAAGGYMVYGGGTNTVDMPLSFVMQFLADQTEADMATSPFADWYGDFVITFTGLENGNFTADGCYLAGHYGDFGWVKVPVDGMIIENGVRYPVMLGVGMGQKYKYICSSVQDFKCALYLTPEILAANPNIQVKLELAVVDNSNDEDAAASALVNNENVYSVTEYTYDAEDFVVDPNYIAELTIDDANPVDYTSEFAGKTVGELTYTRTLIEGIWNPLYLPFEMSIDDLSENYEFAYYNQMISVDADENGVYESYKMEIAKLLTGTLRANYPYFIKPKSADACDFEYVVNDVVLADANEIVIQTSSVANIFKLHGSYKAMTVSELSGKYVVSVDGSWKESTTALKPHRLYLEIDVNPNSPFATAAAKSIGIVVRGEDDEDGTTGIDGIYGDENGETVIFDLYGRRVLEPEKGNIYIINGKKVLVK